MAEVIVLDYRRPRIKLLGWLLEDSGMRVDETTCLEEAVARSHEPDCRCLILNADAPTLELASALDELRACRPGAPLAIIEPAPGAAAMPRVACIRRTPDPDDLVQQVRRICAEAA